jgi:hypothetical protein
MEKKTESPVKESPASKMLKEQTFKSNRDLLLALYILIKANKKWWLIPLLMVLAFLSLFVSLTGNQSILPAIYALF